MSEMPKKYYNPHMYPVILPSKTGGSKTIRSGDSTTDPWFSRFVKSGQLSSVDVDKPIPTSRPNIASSRPPVALGPRRDTIPAPPPKVRSHSMSPSHRVIDRHRPHLPRMRVDSCASSCQASCESKCQDACEFSSQVITAFSTHTQIANRYYCKFCDWVTEQESSISAHMQSYHKDELSRLPSVEVPKGAGNPTVGTPTGVKTEDSVVSVGNNKKLYQMVSGSRLEYDDEYAFKLDNRFYCKRCDYSSTAKNSLSRHINKDHPRESPHN